MVLNNSQAVPGKTKKKSANNKYPYCLVSPRFKHDKTLPFESFFFSVCLTNRFSFSFFNILPGYIKSQEAAIIASNTRFKEKKIDSAKDGPK